MATLNASSGLMTFPAGGQILIGSDTVINIVDGSVRWKPGFRARIRHYDQGVPLAPIEGIKDYGSIDFAIKCGDLLDSSAYATLMAQPSPVTGVAKTFSVVIKRFAAPGLTAGESITFSDAFLAVAPEFSGGDGTNGLDTMTFSLGFSADAAVANIT